jgi:hypothetical protein
MHPQLSVRPSVSDVPGTTFSLPQSHRQSDLYPHLVFFDRPDGNQDSEALIRQITFDLKFGGRYIGETMQRSSVRVRANGGDPIAALHPPRIEEHYALSMNNDMVLGFHPDFAAQAEPDRPAAHPTGSPIRPEAGPATRPKASLQWRVNDPRQSPR